MQNLSEQDLMDIIFAVRLVIFEKSNISNGTASRFISLEKRAND